MRADLLVLKHAGGYYGADAAVAGALGYSAQLDKGDVDVVRSNGAVASNEVAFFGTAILPLFRYPQIQAFGRRAIEWSAKHKPEARTLAMTCHGVGYGLDEREAFLSLLTGMMLAELPEDHSLGKVVIAELLPERAERLDAFLAEFESVKDDAEATADEEPPQRQTPSTRLAEGDWSSTIVTLVGEALPWSELPSVEEFSALLTRSFGARSETKPRVFVAMPFDETFEDEYQIAFVEATHKNGLLCERMDLTHFVGDIVEEMKRKITSASVVIALVNEPNPNVFLEIGYALATNVPVLFVCRRGVELPFDVRNQRTLLYDSIFALRKALTVELENLIATGVVQVDDVRQAAG